MKNLLLAQIKAEFKRRGITQKDIAERLGKTPGTVNNWFTKGNVSVKKIDEIFTLYEIKLDKIVFK